MQRIKKFWDFLSYSFPTQLLLIHLRTHQIFLIIWGLLFLTIFENFGLRYGIPYLLLDPEYDGRVDFQSFFIVGCTIGAFIMTWNIATYILHSLRYPFMATFDNPFAMYCLNNSIIPLGFLGAYTYQIFVFQGKIEKIWSFNLLYDIMGLLTGTTIVLIMGMLYFQATNKDIFKLFGSKITQLKNVRKSFMRREDRLWQKDEARTDNELVKYCLTSSFHFRHTRGISHYETEMVKSVFRQNHTNALAVLIIIVAILFSLGFLIDNPAFRIPSGASAFLFFGVIISGIGVFSYWFGTWKLAALILSMMLINYLIIKDIFKYDNKAYGLNYQGPKVSYDSLTLSELSIPDNVEIDRKYMLSMLETWKKNTGEEKPKMILINVSGGGIAASLFSFLVLQQLDTLTNGDIWKHTPLITGASGGMMGAAYFRELLLRKHLKQISSVQSSEYRSNISDEMLNSISFSLLVNDIYYPWRTFHKYGFKYKKDRGYIFENQFNENTDKVLDHTISYYRKYEAEANIPMIILSPTIINDNRLLFISPHPVSWLMRPYSPGYKSEFFDIDAVDFRALFSQLQSDSLGFLTAVRMNATYPYVLPYVELPSKPGMKVMDAGYRDNTGTIAATRFIKTFDDWIQQNTSGVIYIQITAYPKSPEIKTYEMETLISRTLKPVSSIYSNHVGGQDYENNERIHECRMLLGNMMQVVPIELKTARKDLETSLSFRLTQQEKIMIMNAVKSDEVFNNLKKIKSSLHP